VLKEVTAAEIARILEVTDGLGIHREQVAIPLLARHPGRLRRTPAGKLEIVVDAQADFEVWLTELPGLIRAVWS
jgi:hypothetical protein